MVTACVRRAAILQLELVLMHPAPFVPPELSMKLLHPEPSIHVCLARQVPTASQAAQLPAALEYAPLGVTRCQEVGKAHRAPLPRRFILFGRVQIAARRWPVQERLFFEYWQWQRPMLYAV